MANQKNAAHPQKHERPVLAWLVMASDFYANFLRINLMILPAEECQVEDVAYIMFIRLLNNRAQRVIS